MVSKFIWKIKFYIAETFGLKVLVKNPNVTIAKSASVRPTSNINCGVLGRIDIGENTFINEFCSIFTFENVIKIGQNVLIGPSTVMHTFSHNFDRNDLPIKEQGGKEKPIVIENDVWIGANCTILGGVRIGSHSVIGAHSLVNRDIPPHSLAYGVPCVVKKNKAST